MSKFPKRSIMESFGFNKNPEDKINYKQVICKNEGKTSREVLFITNIKLKNVILQQQEDLVNNEYEKPEQLEKIINCRVNMAIYHNVREEQIQFSRSKMHKLWEHKYHIKGFFIDDKPEGYTKFHSDSRSEEYEGCLKNGMLHDTKATWCCDNYDGSYKYVGGF